MNTAADRATALGEAVQSWIDDESGLLGKALKATLDEQLFFRDDVNFALDHVRSSVSAESLKDWASKFSNQLHETESASGKKMLLCLHAGNLPLVGLQDILAVLISGHHYAGKISRKDPHLLSSLLRFLQENTTFDIHRYSTKIEDFTNLEADAVMFSGSESSVADVRRLLADKNMLAAGAAELIRTAHSSVAWIPQEANFEAVAAELVEAMFRYEGKGCRSLTTVFTDGDTRSLVEAIEAEAGASSYIKENLSVRKLSPLLHYKRSFYRALDQQCFSAGDRLIAATDPDLHTDGLVTITRADKDECIHFAEKNRRRIQSLYTTDTNTGFGQIVAEPIGFAQRPPVNWKPDGVDPLHWLYQPEQKPGPEV
ncbi:MAG: hypothetical protein LAT84_07825 [Balneolia bacterium]|nr:hypothetical protein [Balneolia bacterium]